MIRVDIKQKHIEISGHAMFDDFGKDIVCASVSSIVITSINGILTLDNKALKYDLSDDGITIDVLSDKREVRLLIINMITLLKELEKQYKKNIKVNEEV